MEEKKQGSLDLLRGKLSWSDKDPYWFRIVMALIVVAFLLAIVWMLKAYAIPALTGFKLPSIFGKGSSP